MKTLVIPDIHNKHLRAQKFIDAYPADARIFLGDIYDDFEESIRGVEETARWHVEQLADQKNTFLLGNHDMHYRYQHRVFTCSGYEPAKNIAINRIVTDWGDPRLYAWVDGYLLSHAGVDQRGVPEMYWGDEAKLDLYLASQAEQALANAAEGKLHWMTAPGAARGGWAEFGGLTWLDWALEFRPIPMTRQIVGHTPTKTVKMRGAGVGEINNYLIDTHLRHVAMITDGSLEIIEGVIDETTTSAS